MEKLCGKNLKVSLDEVQFTCEKSKDVYPLKDEKHIKRLIFLILSKNFQHLANKFRHSFNLIWGWR